MALANYKVNPYSYFIQIKNGSKLSASAIFSIRYKDDLKQNI